MRDQPDACTHAKPDADADTEPHANAYPDSNPNTYADSSASPDAYALTLALACGRGHPAAYP